MSSLPILDTRNLVLREIKDLDAEDYHHFYGDPKVMRTWGTKPHKHLEETLSVIQLHRRLFEQKRAIRLGIFLKETGTLIGDVGFWRIVPERFRAEAGAKLARDYWNQSFMTEAFDRFIQFAFEDMGLHSIEANIDPKNVGAIKVVERLGFSFDGMIREHSFCYWEQGFIDTALYSLLRQERLAQIGIV